MINNSTDKQGKFSSWLLVFITLSLVGVLDSIVEATFLQQALHSQQQETRDQLSTLRTRIEGVINSNISLIIGFASVITTTPNINQQLFSEIGEQVLSQSNVLRNIAGAPEMILSLMHPMQGNEAALGLNFLTHPLQRATALKVIETGKLMLAGPVDLLQGGQGLIARIPIFTKISSNPRERKLWGILSGVMDTEKFYAEAGLIDENMLLNVAIKGKDAMGEKGDQFYGSSQIFDQSPVTTDINLPFGSWQLAVVPKNNWVKESPYVWQIRGLSLFIALLLSTLVYSRNRNILQQQQFREELQESNRRFTSVLDGINSVVYVADMDTYEVLYANPKALETYGKNIIGKKCWQSLQINQTGPCDFCTNKHLLNQEGKPASTYIWEQYNPFVETWYQNEDQAIHWDDGHLVRMQLSIDISQIKKSEGQLLEAHKNLEAIAYYDPLTNLPNRRQFETLYNHATSLLKRSKDKLAICYLDLDGFKTINDSYGHNVGDELLIQVSNRIDETIRHEDTVARWGGDEFAFLLKFDRPESCTSLLERILQNISNQYQLTSLKVDISASIGISIFPDDGQDLDTLLRQADQAMYQAKQRGKQQFCFYDSDQDKKIHIKRDHLIRVSNAISNNEMELYFQPKVSVNNSSVFGVEVLVRWMHPEEGLIPPLQFLPLIHGTDTQCQLDWWVISTAIKQALKWQAENRQLSVSINVSPFTLQKDDFTEKLKSLLGNKPLQNNLIELEILESEVADIEKIIHVIKELKSMNIDFALDDYGTGYSSLTYLRQLPVQTLKIDQSFVRDMLVDQNDLNIVEGVIGLAKAFKKEIIAEGVESIQHGVELAKMGCNNLQGYGIARPMPLQDLNQWLNSYQLPDEWNINNKKFLGPVTLNNKTYNK